MDKYQCDSTSVYNDIKNLCSNFSYNSNKLKIENLFNESFDILLNKNDKDPNLSNNFNEIFGDVLLQLQMNNKFSKQLKSKFSRMSMLLEKLEKSYQENFDDIIIPMLKLFLCLSNKVDIADDKEFNAFEIKKLPKFRDSMKFGTFFPKEEVSINWTPEFNLFTTEPLKQRGISRSSTWHFKDLKENNFFPKIGHSKSTLDEGFVTPGEEHKEISPEPYSNQKKVEKFKITEDLWKTIDKIDPYKNWESIGKTPKRENWNIFESVKKIAKINYYKNVIYTEEDTTYDIYRFITMDELIENLCSILLGIPTNIFIEDSGTYKLLPHLYMEYLTPEVLKQICQPFIDCSQVYIDFKKICLGLLEKHEIISQCLYETINSYLDGYHEHVLNYPKDITLTEFYTYIEPAFDQMKFLLLTIKENDDIEVSSIRILEKINNSFSVVTDRNILQFMGRIFLNGCYNYYKILDNWIINGTTPSDILIDKCVNLEADGFNLSKIPIFLKPVADNILLSTIVTKLLHKEPFKSYLLEKILENQKVTKNLKKESSIPDLSAYLEDYKNKFQQKKLEQAEEIMKKKKMMYEEQLTEIINRRKRIEEEKRMELLEDERIKEIRDSLEIEYQRRNDLQRENVIKRYVYLSRLADERFKENLRNNETFENVPAEELLENIISENINNTNISQINNAYEKENECIPVDTGKADIDDSISIIAEVDESLKSIDTATQDSSIINFAEIETLSDQNEKSEELIQLIDQCDIMDNCTDISNKTNEFNFYIKDIYVENKNSINEFRQLINQSINEVTIEENTDYTKIKLYLINQVQKPLINRMIFINKCSLNLMFDEFLLNLEYLRQYYLFLNGEFCRRLTIQLCSLFKTGSPSKFLIPRKLNHLLPKRLSFLVKDLPEIFDSVETNLFEFLTLSFAVEWPMNLVITEKIISKYNLLFGFFLKIERASLMLDQLFLLLKYKTKIKNSKHYIQIQLYRHLISHYIYSLKNYFVTIILETSWQNLKKCLKKSNSIDELNACHILYLKDILRGCFLSQKLRKIHHFIMQLLKIVYMFCESIKYSQWITVNQTIINSNFNKIFEIYNSFDQMGKFILKYCEKLIEKGYERQLINLINLTDINNFYCNVDSNVS